MIRSFVTGVFAVRKPHVRTGLPGRGVGRDSMRGLRLRLRMHLLSRRSWRCQAGRRRRFRNPTNRAESAVAGRFRGWYRRGGGETREGGRRGRRLGVTRVRVVGVGPIRRFDRRGERTRRDDRPGAARFRPPSPCSEEPVAGRGSLPVHLGDIDAVLRDERLARRRRGHRPACGRTKPAMRGRWKARERPDGSADRAESAGASDSTVRRFVREGHRIADTARQFDRSAAPADVSLDIDATPRV